MTDTCTGPSTHHRESRRSAFRHNALPLLSYLSTHRSLEGQGETLEPVRQVWGWLNAFGHSSITRPPCNISGPTTSLEKPYFVKGSRISGALRYEAMAFSQRCHIHTKANTRENSTPLANYSTYCIMPEYRCITMHTLWRSAGKNQDDSKLGGELQEALESFVSILPEQTESDGWSRDLWAEKTQMTEATARLRLSQAFQDHTDLLDFLDLQSEQK